MCLCVCEGGVWGEVGADGGLSVWVRAVWVITVCVGSGGGGGDGVMAI